MLAVPLTDRLGRPYTSMMDPALRIGLAPPNKGLTFEPEIYSDVEMAALLRAFSRRGRAGVRNRAMVVIGWRCGLRVAEICALERSDVDFDLSQIVVRHGKGAKRRVVPMDDHVAAAIERWLVVRGKLPELRRNARLFCTITRGTGGGRVTEPAFRKMLHQAGARAAIDKRVHPHGLRHTCAVRWRRAGIDLELIRQLLGHTDIRTTQRYFRHVDPFELVEAAARVPFPEEALAVLAA